jgi:protein Tob/BTG
MLHEVRSAVNFVTNILQKGTNIDTATVETFKQSLFNFLCLHYQDHWFPEKPNKGSAYRCMRIVNKKMDPLILRAGVHCGLTEHQLRLLFPSELTVWVDPNEVSYRIGEEGSIGVLFEESDRKSASPDVNNDQQASGFLHQHQHQQQQQHFMNYSSYLPSMSAMYFNSQGLDTIECMAS